MCSVVNRLKPALAYTLCLQTTGHLRKVPAHMGPGLRTSKQPLESVIIRPYCARMELGKGPFFRQVS